MATAIEQRALLRSLDAFLALRAGETKLTARVLLDRWRASCALEIQRLKVTVLNSEWVAAADREIRTWAESMKDQAVPDLLEDYSASVRSLIEATDYTEWHLLYNQAIEQVITRGRGFEYERTILRSLMTRLQLSQDDVGRMLGVSGETVRRWELGATGIPVERQAAILAAEAGLRRLQDLFRPERLATVVRRAADLFDGDTALEWILRGRIAEVADRYETSLLYQA
jgi:transcriptional regulator with XRE-family HTH domain